MDTHVVTLRLCKHPRGLSAPSSLPTPILPLKVPTTLILTCLLRNLYAGQEATVRTGHGSIDWFQIGKGVCQGYILSPCLFNLSAEYIMRNAGLDETQAGVKIGKKISITSDTQMMLPLCQKSKRN